jgi:hypothetical protein
MSQLKWFENFSTYDLLTKKLLIALSDYNFNARSYTKLREITNMTEFQFDCVIRCLIADEIITVFNSANDQNILMVSLTERLEITPTLLIVLKNGTLIDSLVLETNSTKDNKKIIKFFDKHILLSKDEAINLFRTGRVDVQEGEDVISCQVNLTKISPSK